MLRAVPQSRKPFREITTHKQLKENGQDLSRCVLIDLNLKRRNAASWRNATIDSTFFFGCRFDSFATQTYLEQRKAVVLPFFERLPYNPFRYRLYKPDELQKKSRAGTTRDQLIYCDYLAKGKWSADLIEAMCRRIHDDGIDDALARLVREIGAANVVAFMGGSASKRSDLFYRKTAETARLLTRENYFVVSGGGPGMMEAANLGAYLAAFPDDALDAAIAILQRADVFDQNIGKWIDTANEVKAKFPGGAESLGVPTWFYGSEPTNLFSAHVAKYFDNSIREGGLVQIGRRAIVFAPGSAGTRQEIFMDMEQNHYGTIGQYTPMIFLGKQQYTVDAPLYPLIRKLANDNYRNLLGIADNAAEVLQFIRTHEPVPKARMKDPICGCPPRD